MDDLMWWTNKKLLVEILQAVRNDKGVTIMALVDDISAKLDAIGTSLTNISADEKVLADEITALQAQVAAGSPATTAQLQGLLDKANNIAAQADAIDTSVPPAQPNP